MSGNPPQGERVVSSAWQFRDFEVPPEELAAYAGSGWLLWSSPVDPLESSKRARSAGFAALDFGRTASTGTPRTDAGFSRRSDLGSVSADAGAGSGDGWKAQRRGFLSSALLSAGCHETPDSADAVTLDQDRLKGRFTKEALALVACVAAEVRTAESAEE